MRQKSNQPYFQRRLLAALKEVPAARQREFCAAAKISARMDPKGTPPNPASVRSIYNDFGFTPDEQFHWGLAIRRPAAAREFLSEYTIMNQSRERKMNVAAYKSLFRRSPATFPASQSFTMLLTYAEWCHLAKVLHEPRLPDEMNEILNGR